MIFLLTLCLASCASSKADRSTKESNKDTLLYSTNTYYDPLEPLNRPIFTFNHYVYKYALSPLATGYNYIVPSPVKKGLTNFFSNLREPIYSVLHLAQGKFTQAGKNIFRLFINSTVGFFGILDISKYVFNIQKKTTSLGSTLAFYDIGSGPYIVLPILGPSDLRASLSTGFDYVAHPLKNIPGDQHDNQILLFESIHLTSAKLENYPEVVSEKDDKYSFIRNMYIQDRQRNLIYEVNNSNEN